MKMDIQRLRNLTTGKLHTKMEHIYEDLEIITGEPGIMTHMIPRIYTAVKPWLKQHVTDGRFWNDRHDPEHCGDYPLPTATAFERERMFEIFKSLPNPLEGKRIIGVVVTTPEGEK